MGVKVFVVLGATALSLAGSAGLAEAGVEGPVDNSINRDQVSIRIVLRDSIELHIWGLEARENVRGNLVDTYFYRLCGHALRAAIRTRLIPT